MENNQHTVSFAVTLQQHRYLGYIFQPYIIKLISQDGGIYTIVEGISQSSSQKWNHLLPANSSDLFKVFNDLSDTSIVKQFSKTKVSSADFFKTLSGNNQLYEFVKAYIDRRMLKCFDLLVRENIPTYLKEKNFSNVYNDHHLVLVDEFALPVFNFSVGEAESKYWISATCKGENIKLTNRNAEIISSDPCLIRIDKKLYKFSGIDGKKLSPFFAKPHISIPKSAEKKYFETFVLNAVRTQIVNPEGFIITKNDPPKRVTLSLENRLSGGVALILKFVYGNKSYLANAKIEPEVYLSIENDKYSFNRFERDSNWENECINSLIDLGLVKVGEAEFYPKDFTITDSGIEPYQLIEWMNSNTELLINKGFEINQNLGQTSYYIKNVEIRINTSSPDDWFDLHGEVILNEFRIPFTHLKKNILKNIREFVLPNGQIFILPKEWFARYKPIFTLGKETGDKISMHKSLFNLLESSKVETQSATDLRSQFQNYISETFKLPSGLNADLRDYQKHGYLWLSILNRNNLGGCLADDMGLGKTVQALALLQSQKENKVDGNITSLIVVPTSLVHNWIREISRFTPNLSYLDYTGSNRINVRANIFNYHLVITTYGIIRNDIDFLKDVQFNYIILDESQAIKNPFSKTYRSALLLKASHFLTISGTPIENSLADLWSQMNFVNRGMLGSLKTFNQEFIQPISKNEDEAQSNLLKKIIEPFILRRTKEQVAKDLPELSEQVVYCDMTEEQERIYETEKSSIRNAIIEQISTQGYNRSAIAILRGLTRLRQVANHPLMVDEASTSESGKFDEISRSIESIVSEGHKILVFSSFVKHLKLISNQLDKSEIPYEMLTGNTTNRKEVVDRFQNNPEIKLFLISIKAGGVGLNLTAADYIFILDPWWNPAVENQALARAHRIGQDKKTFVYRFISLNTVEEKIQRLQEKKELLAEFFIENSNPLSILGEKRIMELVE